MQTVLQYGRMRKQPGVGKTHLASALGLVAAQHRFSTYYVNCHQLIEQLKRAPFREPPAGQAQGAGQVQDAHH